MKQKTILELQTDYRIATGDARAAAALVQAHIARENSERGQRMQSSAIKAALDFYRHVTGTPIPRGR